MFRIVYGIVLAWTAFATAQPTKDWKGKDLSKRDLSNENLNGVNLVGANLTNANLKDGRLRGANLHGANLTGANLEGADLRGANLVGAIFAKTNLQKATLSEANLTGVDFAEVSLHGADFRNAHLALTRGFKDITKTDFRTADLRGADFTGAVDTFEQAANFTGAKSDAKSVWPKNFQATSRGIEHYLPLDAGELPQLVDINSPTLNEIPKPPAGSPTERDVKGMLENEVWRPTLLSGAKHTYTYKYLNYDKPRIGSGALDEAPDTVTGFPVHVSVTIKATSRDGTTKSEVKEQTFVFFKDTHGDWAYKFVTKN